MRGAGRALLSRRHRAKRSAGVPRRFCAAVRFARSGDPPARPLSCRHNEPAVRLTIRRGLWSEEGVPDLAARVRAAFRPATAYPPGAFLVGASARWDAALSAP